MPNAPAGSRNSLQRPEGRNGYYRTNMAAGERISNLVGCSHRRCLAIIGTEDTIAVLTVSSEERSGRQGDPGSSQFYVSLEDDLMRLFASDRIAAGWQKWLE